ncbi:MAG: hypothetical protein ABL876_03130 [Chitinophagaceae bacterium]
MRVLILSIVSAFCLSCNTGESKDPGSSKDTAGTTIDSALTIKDDINISLECDTTVKYEIEDISSEGAEANACYRNNSIYQCRVVVFGAGGRADLQYNFNDSVVMVKEYLYKYSKPLAEIKNDTDIHLSDSLFYTLDKKSGKAINGEAGNEGQQLYLSIIKKVSLSL